MHGCNLRNAPLVNAEVDSMGGVIDSGVGIGVRSSPQRAAIEKAQSELRREYDVREERRRELAFLEKGGNPLDFKFGNSASVSVQSTSLADQPPEQFVTSEAKGSFALTASPHGDSVESSGRPDAPVVSEPNCADNLLLFDGENDSVVERNSLRFARSKIAPSEQISQVDTRQNVKESGETAVFGFPKNQAYKRRNRSRPIREGARSSSIDIGPSQGVHASSLPSFPGEKDVKRSALDTDNQHDQNASLNHNLKPTISNGIIAPTDLPSDGVIDMLLDNGQAVESTGGPTEVVRPKPVLDCESQMSEGQLVVSPHVDCPSVLAKPVNQTDSVQQNGFCDAKGDEGRVTDESLSCSANLVIKGLDLESYYTATSLSLDRTSDSVPLNGSRSDDFHENTRVEILISSVSPTVESDEKLKAKDNKKADDRCSLAMDEHSSVSRSHPNDSSFRLEEEPQECGSGSKGEVKHTVGIEGTKLDGITASEIENKPGNLSSDDLVPAKQNVCSSKLGGSMDEPADDNPSLEKEKAYNRLQDPSVPGLHSQTALQSRDSSDAIKHNISTETPLKLDVKAHEDSILKEARIIEAKRKRIAQLSVGAFTSENHHKSHWDLVLEEMAWLANDFAQERLWKIYAAAQLSHRVSSTSRVRLAGKSLLCKQKKIAHTLSKAIMEFWLSAEELGRGTTMQCPGRNSVRKIQEYAVRYLKYNASLLPLYPSEAPATPERIYDLGTQELPWEEQFTEENLFYTVPPGAMETYRKDIESSSSLSLCPLSLSARECVDIAKKTGSSIQEEIETSTRDAAADHGSQGNAYEEDEGGRNTKLLSGDVESGKPLKFEQKKRNLIKISYARSSGVRTNLPFMQHTENKLGTQQSGLTVKRPANNLHISSIPTKRMRTASRPRFTTPFTAGTSGDIQVPNRTDASSSDTNSFQDDQSTFHGGSEIPDNMEVESVADFERQLPFDSPEVSKPKKKKKPKHPGSTYEQRWQLENNFQNELGGYSRKRIDKLVESNGSNGLFGQPVIKKQKMMRQPMDSSLDNCSPLAGSVPSPVASQMSNMSNSNKLVKILGGRDRGRKSRSLKMPVGQTGPGSPWSSFEEQALIVLVHDLGPNWELISDAINNILQYKCIFRKPKECSEHHKELISRTAGDGADSAEDSGSSQPYPSTLPGIPKGSARALFQRLQEPIEEDMIKFHFEKIILMSQKQHYVKMQNETPEQKPIQPHSSHALALSQVCPNNTNAGPLLTPLDLCDATASSPDVLSGGYQGAHGGGLALSNQCSAASSHPTSAANSALQGSPHMGLGNNFLSSPTPVNSSMRDGRFGAPRSASLSVDEHQRVQQYNQMMPGKVSVTHPGTDRGVRMISGGNGMGIKCGMNRNMTMARPSFPGIGPSSVLNSGSMLPSNMAVLAEPANLHSGVGAGPGNSMLRPRDPSNMMRVPEHQRQMMVPDHQMQVTRGNIQGVPPFGGINSGLSNQTSPPSPQTHHFHHQQQHQSPQQQSHVHNNLQHPHLQGADHVSNANHVSSAQHQAYAIRLAKERHLQLQQQRLLQPQQLAASSAIMPRGPSQTQASLHGSSHVQPSASTSVSAPFSTSSSVMPSMPSQGLTRNLQVGGNHMGKQRQREMQQQQQNSHLQAVGDHPQQRSHPQQHAKLVKGAGRGNMTMHRSLNIDPSILNGLSPATGSQSTEKAGQVISTMQGQGLYPVSGLNPHHLSNKAPIQPQKFNSGQAIASSKQAQQLPSHLVNSDQGHASPSTSGSTLSTPHRAASPSITPSSNSLQLLPTQKLANQIQLPVERLLQQNRKMNSDSMPSKLLADQGQSEQLHASGSSSPSQLGTTAVSLLPSIELSSVKPMVSSTSANQSKTPKQVQTSIIPNLATLSAPIGNSLTSLSRTQSQGSGEDQASVSRPIQMIDAGTQKQKQQAQLQTSSFPPPLEQHPLPAQKLQVGNSNLYVNARSTDNRLE